MAGQEDLCFICTEPLEHCAVLPCGHNDVCCLCTVRMRLIMSDKKCCVCQKEAESAFITRHQGSFTCQFPHDLKRRKKEGSVSVMENNKQCRDIYFEDDAYRKEMSTKCAFSCSVCCKQGKEVVFGNLKQLKAHLKEEHGLFMCDVCLAGRKVFCQEQVLYTRSELSRHYKRGDTKGVMAEAGFKGHPTCQFCNKHFYSDQELYSHMQTRHMQCFLCKRERPNEYIYYKNLTDLTNHFESHHYFCNHEDCKFKHPEERVFKTKEELNVHCVQTHGESLSKSQKKQALQISVDYGSLRYQDDQEEEEEAPMEFPRANSGSNLGQSSTLDDFFPALDDPRADIFAGVDSSQTHWRRAAGGGVGSGGSGGPHRHNQFSMEEYPTLPGMSKSAKKRAKAKARAAEAVSHRGRQSAWDPSAQGSSFSGQSAPASRFTDEQRSKNRLLMQELRRELDSIAFNAFRQESANFLNGETSPETYYRQIKRLGLGGYAKDLALSLPDPKEGLRAALLGLIAKDQRDESETRPRVGQRDESQKLTNLASLVRNPSSAPRQPRTQTLNFSRADQFPTLSSTASAGHQQPEMAQPQPPPQPAQSQSQSQSRGKGKTKTQASAQNKQANKKVMERLQKELDPQAFAAFRAESMRFIQGSMSTDGYYDLVVSLGLAGHVEGLANSLPEAHAQKKKALMDLHKGAMAAQMHFAGGSGGSTSSGGTRGGGGGGSKSFGDEDDPPKPTGKAGRKKKKQGKFERIRLGHGVTFEDALSLNNNNNNGGRSRVNPNNSWSQSSGNSLF